MTLNPAKFTDANRAVVDSLMAVANTALAAAERVVALNVDTVRSMVRDSSENAKTLLGAKNAQEAIGMQANQAQPSIEKAVAYSRALYEISSMAQEELTKLAQSQYGEFQTQISNVMKPSNAASAAPFDFAVAAIKQAMSATNTVYENAAKKTKK